LPSTTGGCRFALNDAFVSLNVLNASFRASDGRYTIAALTDAGYEVVAAAAPTHVRAVRQLVLDPLTAADQQALARIAAKLRMRPVDLA
jgi:DNA-binding MarR family transcriptional regulator